MTIEIYTDPMTKEEWVITDKGNGEFTSMSKSVYDQQQKALKDAAN